MTQSLLRVPTPLHRKCADQQVQTHIMCPTPLSTSLNIKHTTTVKLPQSSGPALSHHNPRVKALPLFNTLSQPLRPNTPRPLIFATRALLQPADPCPPFPRRSNLNHAPACPSPRTPLTRTTQTPIAPPSPRTQIPTPHITSPPVPKALRLPKQNHPARSQTPMIRSWAGTVEPSTPATISLYTAGRPNQKRRRPPKLTVAPKAQDQEA